MQVEIAMSPVPQAMQRQQLQYAMLPCSQYLRMVVPEQMSAQQRPCSMQPALTRLLEPELEQIKYCSKDTGSSKRREPFKEQQAH